MKSDKSQAKPAPRIELPPLTAFGGDGLETGCDYDGIDFVDQAFTGQDAADVRFLECRMEGCCLEGLSLRRARVVSSLLSEAFGASVDFADSTWRDSQISGGRLGALILPGATMKDVRLRGIKLGFVNLAGARLEDVVFEECEIGGLDARVANLRAVTFLDCSIGELNVAEATLARVDLSGAKLKTLIGVESLKGAIISHQQMLDLAPLLAARLGVEVRPDTTGGES